MEKEQLAETLLKWLQTFNVAAPHATLYDISDGVAMAQVLTQIAPECFTQAWMAKIKTDVANNWRLKVSNLKKLLKGILEYYQEMLGQHITDFNMPDVNKIGEHNNPAELGRMLQLILGCAINCEMKQEYIETIMGMEESVQQMIMKAIQELMTKETGGLESLPDVDAPLKKVLDDLEAANVAKEHMAQRCHELDMKVALLQEEKANLHGENERLQERLREMEVVEDASMGGSGQRYKEVKKQLESVQEEMYKLETSRDDYRVKVEQLERELLELQGKQDELQKAAEEAHVLKDEVDVLRERVEQLSKCELAVEGYKKKLEDYADLKRQVRILEEKNTDYMQQNMELEEELKKSGTWKPQLEMYKKQVSELHKKLGEETKKADKAEFENKKTQEKLLAIQREKERLIAERDSLRESNEELKCTQLQLGTSNLSSVMSPESGTRNASSLSETDTLEMIPPEIKEKLLRLQHENKMLRLSQLSPTDEDQVPILQAVADDLRQRQSELQTENRLANQRVLELENQVEELQEKLGTQATTGQQSSEVRQKLSHLSGKVKDLEKDKDTQRAYIEELEAKLQDSRSRVSSLEDVVSHKDGEMKEVDERYKKYMEKLKSINASFDLQQGAGGGAAADVAVLKAQLADKDRRIDHLERETEKSRRIKETEEQLITTAFYNYTYQMNRQAAEQRLMSSNPSAQSFLSRQRLATARRVGMNPGTSEFYDY